MSCKHAHITLALLGCLWQRRIATSCPASCHITPTWQSWRWASSCLTPTWQSWRRALSCLTPTWRSWRWASSCLTPTRQKLEMSVIVSYPDLAKLEMNVIVSYPDLAKLEMSVIVSSESWASTVRVSGGEGVSPKAPSLKPVPHNSPNSHPGSWNWTGGTKRNGYGSQSSKRTI